jgi:hypothetical protein
VLCPLTSIYCIRESVVYSLVGVKLILLLYLVALVDPSGRPGLRRFFSVCRGGIGDWAGLLQVTLVHSWLLETVAALSRCMLPRNGGGVLILAGLVAVRVGDRPGGLCGGLG